MDIIKKIEIRHFRSIHSDTLEEISSFNIFAGTNDSGKSNVLRALNLFFNGETSFREKFNFNEDYSKLALLKAREKKKGWQFISIKIYFNEDIIQGKRDLKKLAKANDGLWIKREWKRYEETYRETLPDFIDKASSGLKRSFSVLLSQIKFVYIPAFKSKEVFSHVLSLVGNEEGIFIDERAKNELNEQIAETATELAIDFSGLTDINTKVSLPITLDSFWSSLQVATEFKFAIGKAIKRGVADDYLIGLAARGEGIKSIFTPVVLGWLARNIKGRYWIWGIDEPENSLESSRAAALLSKFFDYSKVAQIFVSSHSPTFIFSGKQEDQTNAITYIAKQDKEGDTRFERLDVSEPDLQQTLIKDFGVDYGTYLGVQEEYAKKLRDIQVSKDAMNKKLKEITRPVIFLEGELDERYFKKTIEVLRNGSYPADIRWIGTRENGGQATFTGCSALHKVKAFLSANPDFLKTKVVLSYDVEMNVVRSKQGQLLVLSPKKIHGGHYETGTEHLLAFPDGFDHESYSNKNDTKEGDKRVIITELDKKRLCEYVCNVASAQEQKTILAGIHNYLSELEQFIS